MNRNAIALVWLGGVVLMAVIYVVGPQHFIQACADIISNTWWFIADLIDNLAVRAFDAVRAAAIALYAVFIVLAIMARRRRIRTGGTFVVVSLLFLLLVGSRWYEPGTKWFTAALITAVGAMVMTRRLLNPPYVPRDPRHPWGNAMPGGPDRPADP